MSDEADSRRRGSRLENSSGRTQGLGWPRPGHSPQKVASSTVERRLMSRTEEARKEVSRSIDHYARDHPQLGVHSQDSRLLEAALRLVHGLPGLILDIGCGEGGTLMSLRQRTEARPAIGVELSAHRARIAADKGLRVIVGDGDRLPMPDECASLVISRHVIEHVENDVRSLEEIERVLAPEGFLYLETPLRKKGAWYFYRNAANEWVLDPTHKREYRSVQGLESACLEAGLIPLYTNVGPIRFPLRHIIHRIISLNRPASPRAAQKLDGARAAVSVPRYREIQLLARRRHPGE